MLTTVPTPEEDFSAHRFGLHVEEHGSLRRVVRRLADGSDRFCFWHEIVTWPGVLAFSGDMGDFVFRVHCPKTTDLLRQLSWTSLHYLAEKVVAGEALAYDPGEARAWLNRTMAERDGFDSILAAARKQERWQWYDELARTKEDLLLSVEDGEDDLAEAIDRAQDELFDGRPVISELCELNLRWPTYRFRWAVAAIGAARDAVLAQGHTSEGARL